MENCDSVTLTHILQVDTTQLRPSLCSSFVTEDPQSLKNNNTRRLNRPTAGCSWSRMWGRSCCSTIVGIASGWSVHVLKSTCAGTEHIVSVRSQSVTWSTCTCSCRWNPPVHSPTKSVPDTRCTLRRARANLTKTRYCDMTHDRFLTTNIRAQYRKILPYVIHIAGNNAWCVTCTIK